MKFEKLMCIAAIALLVVLAVPVSLAAQDNPHSKDAKFITFNAPGAGTGAGQGTISNSINPAGAITGYYLDASDVYHGFLRAADGTFTTFDVLDAGTSFYEGTGPLSINPAGAITGWYFDTSNVIRGFLRTPDGAITTFSAPRAGTGASQGGGGLDINPAGAIAGNYVEASNAFRSYLFQPDGTFATFEAPGAGTGFYQGTQVAIIDGLNPAGAITGGYVDASNVYHGYIRSAHGTFTIFQAPGA
ncbi:MAG: hypothetical protein WBY98_19685, partial [Candidatus Sulfotelmatobacter sp.]